MSCLLGLGLNRARHLFGLFDRGLTSVKISHHTYLFSLRASSSVVASKAAKQTRRRLEGTLQVARRWHSPNPDLCHVRIKGVFKRNNALDNKPVC